MKSPAGMEKIKQAKSSKVSPSFRSKARRFSVASTRTPRMEIQQMLAARNGQMVAPTWRPWYSNQQRILIVGDGDLSFASCVATELGFAPYMVATSLDSEGELLQKYGMDAEFNIFTLKYHRGARVLYGFDACKMATQQKYLLWGFRMAYFDRIIFNFPHAGFYGREDDPNLMMKHKELVRLFFANAREMLLPGGQVHVSHKLGHPYDEWKLEEQAQVNGLRCVARVPFHQAHYPGYQNRRGHGFRAGESFKLGPADTYIFAARTMDPTASTLNVGEPLGMSSIMLAHLKSLQEKAVRKAGAPRVASLQQVVADELTGLEKLPLGKKKMNLKNCLEGPLVALAEDLGGSLEEEHAKITEMDMASLSNSTTVRCSSQNIGCTKSTLPPFSPETKLEDMDLVSHVNPNEVSVPEKEDTTESHLPLDSSLGLSQESVGALSTVDKLDEEIKEDCPSSKQKSPLLAQIELMDNVVALQRKKNLESSSLEENSGLNEESVGGSSTASATQFVEGSLEALAEDLARFLPDERIGMVNNSTDIEWGSQCNCCSTISTIQPFSPETVDDLDLLFQVNPGNETVLVTENEDITESHFALEILEPCPQAKEYETIFTADILIEDVIKEDSKKKAGSKHKLKQNLVSKQKSKQKSEPQQKSKKPGTIYTVDNVVEEERKEDSKQKSGSKQKPKKKLKKKSNQKSDSKQAVQEKHIIWSCGGEGHVRILERVQELSRFKQKMVKRGQFSGETSFLHFLGQEVCHLESEEASDPQKKMDCYHKRKFRESLKSTLIEVEVASKENPSVFLCWAQEIAYLETLVEKQGSQISKQKRQRLETLKNARVALEEVVESYWFKKKNSGLQRGFDIVKRVPPLNLQYVVWT